MADAKQQPDQFSSEAFARARDAKVAGDVGHLIAALRDPDERGPAARFLAELGARDAIPDIARLLDADDPSIRVQACKALGALQASEVTPRLLEIAQRDQNDVVRSYAIDALRDIGDPVANETLVSLLADPEVWIRRGAATALETTGDPSAIGPLREASTLEPRWRRGRYSRAIRAIRERS